MTTIRSGSFISQSARPRTSEPRGAARMLAFIEEHPYRDGPRFSALLRRMNLAE